MFRFAVLSLLLSLPLFFGCNVIGPLRSGADAYSESEVGFLNPSDGVRLAGTLTLPRGSGPFAAVVLVGGSGPHQREVRIGTYRPMAELADHLARRGIAVLRYDKRGCGESEGRYEPYDLENFVKDALAGHAFLQAHESLEPQKIGAIGISQGGLVVPRLALRSPNLAFIVLMAAPGIWGKDFFCLSSLAIAEAAGFQERDFIRIRQLWDSLWPLWIRAELANTERLRAIGLLREISSYTDGHNRTLLHQDDPETFFRLMRSPHLLESLAQDPGEVLSQVRCPVLAITGSLDVQTPAKENLSAISAALRRAGHRAFTVTELEGLNHIFQRARTGLPAEYFSGEKMAPEALETISNWILGVTNQ